MVEGSRSAPARELLLANHDFPGEYLIKAFGPARGGFRQDVEKAVGAVVGQRVAYSERVTRSGGRVCVTACLQVETVDEVVLVYERLHALEELKLIL